jgi:chemotaxis protein methyltransferase CheR
MQLWSISNYDEYLCVLKTDPQKYKDFLKKLTINVSEFFRNPERFLDLQQRIFPELIRKNPYLKIWSAGCSDGSEPYTVAIILKEMGLDKRVTIHASDVDREILKRAQEAVYAENEVRNISPALLDKYFVVENNQFRVKDEVKRMVELRQHNLLTDAYQNNWDLIICRNVVIYFTEEAKFTLYTRFFNSLRPGGFLMVGGTEPLLNHRQLGYDSYITSFYRKPESFEEKNG